MNNTVTEQAVAQKNELVSRLREIYDPEISVNIYDLGLIYSISFEGTHCDIVMSLTSAWCPSADEITRSVHDAAVATAGIESCHLKVTFDPPWGTHMMSEEAKLELDLYGFDGPMMHMHGWDPTDWRNDG